MAFWQPVTNLREYVSQNPPSVTFFLCLLSLAVSLICLSVYTSTHSLPNPDTTKDWNHLLSTLSQLRLCVNTSADELESSGPSPQMVQRMNGQTAVNSTKTGSVTSLRLKVPLAVATNSPEGLREDVDLHATLKASQLHLGGDEIVNVSLDIRFENDTYTTCLSVSAPADLLPTSPLPPECPASESNVSPIHVEASSRQLTKSHTCYSLRARNDPSLTVMLTWDEQIVAVRHLLEVGVCLLGVCLMLCLAASLSNPLMRGQQWKGLDLQNEPLIDS